MAELIGGFATSHASAFMTPDKWDPFRAKMRELYRARFGDLPDEPWQVHEESDDDITLRYRRIQDTHDLIRARIRELKPDAVIVLGNDQNENFGEFAAPQFAVYTGKDMVVDDWMLGNVKHYQCHSEIATALLAGLVEQGFDVTQTSRFSDNTLRAHAHAQVFSQLIPDADIPVIPVFVNAITPPLASVQRCFAFGEAIGRAIRSNAPGRRVMLGVSGGLSHFTVGFPYESLAVERTVGTICPDFDARLLDWMRSGELDRFTSLTDEDLLNNGDVEFRQGLAFFGALPPGAKPEVLAYEVFYRSFMGVWSGYWAL